LLARLKQVIELTFSYWTMPRYSSRKSPAFAVVIWACLANRTLTELTVELANQRSKSLCKGGGARSSIDLEAIASVVIYHRGNTGDRGPV